MQNEKEKSSGGRVGAIRGKIGIRKGQSQNYQTGSTSGNGEMGQRPSHTPTYKCWNSMMHRCHSPKNPQYKGYGAKGITVCERWKDYANFLSDMGPIPKGLQLERVNNNLGYSPSNCIWADHTQQSNNRSNNVIWELDGVSKTQAQWAKEYGLSQAVLSKRLCSGWTLWQALNTPMRHARKRSVSVMLTDHDYEIAQTRWKESKYRTFQDWIRATITTTGATGTHVLISKL